MPTTTLPMDDLELVACEKPSAAVTLERSGRAPEKDRARSGDLVLPIFDDDGVMIRVVLTEDVDPE